MNAEIIRQLDAFSETSKVLDIRVHADKTFTIEELQKLVAATEKYAGGTDSISVSVRFDNTSSSK